MPWARLGYTLATTSRRGAIGIHETGQLAGRVLPSDLDFNRHVNNGRYLSLADLGRIDWFVRTGMLRTALKNQWRPIIASGTVRYHRPLKLWQPYRLDSSLVAWGARWAFMEHRFFANNRDGAEKLFATVAIKGAFQGREGVIEPARLMAAMGEQHDSPPIPAWIDDWQQGESRWKAMEDKTPVLSAEAAKA